MTPSQAADYTHKFKHIPIEDVVIRKTLTMKKISKELTQVRIIWFVVEAERATVIEIGSEFG